MKKEIITHFGFLFAIFAAIILLQKWFDLRALYFLIGGVFGTLLPDIDHLIYVYFLRPHELGSQRVNYMLQKNDFIGSAKLLVDTREERKKLIFHTALFQLLFLLLALFVVTSSGSIFGAGIVLAFFLHLLVDHYIDYKSKESVSNWFQNFPFPMDKEKEKLYLIAVGVYFILLVVLL